jgi:hypothetical protein
MTTRKKPKRMKLYLVSASKNPVITRPLLERIAEALEEQQFAHVAPFWQFAGVHVGVIDDISQLPKDDGSAPLVVYDKPDQANALGWHTYNADSGRIHGTAFLEPILANDGSLTEGPNSLSCTLSHEAIEAVCDPYVNAFVFKTAQTIEPIEACDRVEGDDYPINNVSVSNFLGPRAFRDGPGPYDWLRKLEMPWDLTPGGYCERTNIATGKTTTVWGDLMPEWKRELKREKRAFKLSRLANRSMMQQLAAQGD